MRCVFGSNDGIHMREVRGRSSQITLLLLVQEFANDHYTLITTGCKKKKIKEEVQHFSVEVRKHVPQHTHTHTHTDHHSSPGLPYTDLRP